MSEKISSEAAQILREQALKKTGATEVNPGLMGGKRVSRIPGLSSVGDEKQVDFVDIATGKQFSRKLNSNGMAMVGPSDPDFWPGVWRAFFDKKK